MSDQKYNTPRPSIPSETERAVKVDAGHRCSIKHCTEHTYLEIHHINGNREDNRIENLILLCDKHHKMSHSEVIDRKSLREYKKLLCIPSLTNLSDRFEKLEELVRNSSFSISPSPDKAINLILEEAVLLGNNLRGTNRGNKVAQQIFTLIRKHGNLMSLDSVDLMVRRGDSYSRTGLIGLGILYDMFFEHTKSFQLINHFESQELLDIAYYCALREEFPDNHNMSACMKSIGFKYGGFSVMCDASDLLSRYPNRGASAVLDYLVYDDHTNQK